jgi:hypothetical protein
MKWYVLIIADKSGDAGKKNLPKWFWLEKVFIRV